MFRPDFPLGQIAVIEPAVRFPNLDCFNQLALLSPLPLSYHLPALFGFESLQAVNPESVRGLIVLGSAASVNDDAPWQNPLGRWLVEAWSRGVPTLGICFGHQLIAHLLGGKVDLAFTGGEKRRGFRHVRLESAPAWLDPESQLELYMSHREVVVECPPSLRVFARSEEVAVEAVAHRELPVFGFQAHPEATVIGLARHGLDPAEDSGRLADGQRVMRSFLQLCAETV